jgi:hypothetical protein
MGFRILRSFAIACKSLESSCIFNWLCQAARLVCANTKPVWASRWMGCFTDVSGDTGPPCLMLNPRLSDARASSGRRVCRVCSWGKLQNSKLCSSERLRAAYQQITNLLSMLSMLMKNLRTYRSRGHRGGGEGRVSQRRAASEQDCVRATLREITLGIFGVGVEAERIVDSLEVLNVVVERSQRVKRRLSIGTSWYTRPNFIPHLMIRIKD